MRWGILRAVAATGVAAIGAAAAALTVADHFDHGGRSTNAVRVTVALTGPVPRLRVDATAKTGAIAIEHFLRAHQGEVVYVNVSCNGEAFAPVRDIPPNTYCYATHDGWHPKDAFTLSVHIHQTARQWWLHPPLNTPSLGVFWVYFPDKALQAGTHGAGTVEMNGYFRISLSGTGSLGPAGLTEAHMQARQG